MELDPKLVNLIKKNEYLIYFKKDYSHKLVQRLPLSSKKYKEITNLVHKSNLNSIELYFDTYKKITQYCLDIKDNEYDSAIWESSSELESQEIFGLKIIVEACLNRAVNGIAYFSPNLENWILNEGSKPDKLTPEEIEAWNMFLNKQNGIMPNQYHYSYEQGDTLIFPEHIQDLLKIDIMWTNKLKKEQFKAEAKNAPNPLKNKNNSNSGSNNFFGRKFTYKK